MYQNFDTSFFRNAWEGIAPQSRCTTKPNLNEVKKLPLYDAAGLRSNPLPSITDPTPKHYIPTTPLPNA